MSKNLIKITRMFVMMSDVLLFEIVFNPPQTIRRKQVGVKTKKVVLLDGQEGRGVKVTPKNFVDVANWIKGTKTPAEAIVKVHPKKAKLPDENHRVKVHTPSGIRVAYVDDTVVKFDKGVYVVIKAEDFDKVVQI